MGGGLLKPTPPGERGLQQLTSLPIVTTPLTKEPGGEDPLYYIQHIHSWLAHEEQAALTTGLAALHLSPDLDYPLFGIPDQPGLWKDEKEDLLTTKDIHGLAGMVKNFSGSVVCFIRGFVDTGEPLLGPRVDKLRQSILVDFADSFFSGNTTGSPPKRGKFGEAEILLHPCTVPVHQRPYQMVGERRAAWVTLTDQLIADGKIEPGQGPWCSPSFPVPKKKPGEYRLVVDLRRLNEHTIVDSHPLPKIGDILQRQGRFKIWSVLDMKDGYHQVPLKEEHRSLTCMATPRGTMRWRVLVMGLSMTLSSEVPGKAWTNSSRTTTGTSGGP